MLSRSTWALPTSMTQIRCLSRGRGEADGPIDQPTGQGLVRCNQPQGELRVAYPAEDFRVPHADYIQGGSADADDGFQPLDPAANPGLPRCPAVRGQGGLSERAVTGRPLALPGDAIGPWRRYVVWFKISLTIVIPEGSCHWIHPLSIQCSLVLCDR